MMFVFTAAPTHELSVTIRIGSERTLHHGKHVNTENIYSVVHNTLYMLLNRIANLFLYFVRFIAPWTQLDH